MSISGRVDQIHLGLCGPTRLLVRGAEIPLTATEAAVLVIIASEQHVHRRELAELVWPRAQARTGRHSLSQAIYTVRRKAGRDVFDSDSTHVRIGKIGTDTACLNSAVEARRWESAEEIIRGNFGDGLAAEGEALERWISERRAEYRQVMTQVISGLLYEESWSRLERLCQRLRQAVPPFPEAEQGYVVALRGLGRIEEAEQASSTIKLCWTKAFGEAFPLELPNLDSETPAHIRSSASGFVGRSREMALLDSIWHRVQAKDVVQWATIEGEAGIGKTTLAERFARLAAIRGGRVLWATGYEAESKLPFGVIAQWLRDIKSHDLDGLPTPILKSACAAFPFLGESADVASDATMPAAELHLFECLRRVLGHFHSSRPLLLVIDDYQWADPVSQRFVQFLMRIGREGPLLVITLGRTPQSATNLAEVRVRLELTSLTQGEVEALSKRMGLLRSPNDIERIWSRTGGNPFLVVSLLLDHGEPGKSIPLTAADFLSKQLQSLSSAAKRLLTSVAVISTPTDLGTAATIAALDSENADAAAHELMQLRLVSETDEGIFPRHGLIAEVAIRTASRILERELRGRAARLFHMNGRQTSAVIALRYEDVGESEATLEAALQAARGSLALHAYREAEFFLKIAVTQCSQAKSWVPTAISLAQCLVTSGREDEALSFLQSCPFELTAESRNALEAQKLMIECGGAMTIDRFRLALEHAGALEVELDPTTAGEMRIMLAAAAHELGLVEEALQSADAGIALVRDGLDEPRAVRAALRGATVIGLNRNLSRALALIEDFTYVGRRWPESKMLGYLARGSILTANGRLKEAELEMLIAHEMIERLGMLNLKFHALNNLAVCIFEQGRLSDALEIAEQAIEIGQKVGALGQAEIAKDNRLIIKFELGQHEEVMDLTSSLGHQELQGDGSLRSWFCRWSLRGLAALELGRLSEARECHREVELAISSYPYGSNDISYSEIFLARFAERFSDPLKAIPRLSTAIANYSKRDLSCARRMEAELLRIRLAYTAEPVLKRAQQLRQELIDSGCLLLLDRVESLVTRSMQ